MALIMPQKRSLDFTEYLKEPRIQATETKTQIAKDLNISRYSLPDKTSLSR
jgi:hypothetical protein